MSDFGSLRPPASPGRASSPVGGTNPNSNRFSLGKQPSGGGPVRSPSMGATAMPNTPGSVRGLRPSSELLGMAQQGTPESDAIDKWFEDLQNYEATLEEMAAASLDQNFKEELSAIEQWFRVLSEAERTAALYSLLQESTQVQIRFFITVLQQMARSDPMSALLSPSHPQAGSMAEQMEAKLASLGLKSPSAMKSPASPNNRNYRQSSDAAGFLSPNAAATYSPGHTDAAATLAAQRAKLKANRISAPGTLAGEHGSRNFSGGNLDQVQERSGGGGGGAGSGGSESTAGRPKSTDGLSAASKSPRPSGPLDDQLSPITSSGNWASMGNTPLMPMFEDANSKNGGDTNSTLEAAAAQLASVGAQGNRNVMLDNDVSKYRRKSPQVPMSGSQMGGNVQGGAGSNSGVQGVLSGMYSGTGGDHMHHSSPHASPNVAATQASPGPWNASQNDFLRQAMAQTASPNAGQGAFNLAQMSPNSLAGLQSPSGGLGNPMNMQMMNAMAAMGGLGNMSAAQFIQMQQQILQSQQQIAALAAGGNSNLAALYQQQQQQQQLQQGFGSGGQNRGQGLRSGGIFGGTGLSPGSMGASQGRRSPGMTTTRLPSSARTNASSTSTQAAGGVGTQKEASEDDVADINIISDVPTWLRHLRLHKYTPNFETSNWREMVLMDDAALEAKGVAALGARRKMLKTFEIVREKHGITLPGGGTTVLKDGDAKEGEEGIEGGDEGEGEGEGAESLAKEG